MSDIKFIVSVDSKKGTAAIKELDKNIVGIEKSTQKATPAIAGMWKQMAAGISVAYGVRKAFRAMNDFIGDSIKKAGIQEETIKQLEARLRSTGEAAGITKGELIDMATGLQLVTEYGDETIIGAENLLLTFTKIGRNVFPQALEMVLDMSKALGQDLKSSAIQLGKALQDPILGVMALRRVGVNFNKQQAEEIKLLVESGELLKAQKFILQELSTEFGGSARASVDAYQGAIKQLRNTYSDLKEEVGKAVTENEDFRDIIKTITQTIRDFIDSGAPEQIVGFITQFAKEMMAAQPALRYLAAFALLLHVEAEKARLAREEMEKHNKTLSEMRDILADMRAINAEEISQSAQIKVNFKDIEEATKGATEEYQYFMQNIGEGQDVWGKLMFWGSGAGDAISQSMKKAEYDSMSTVDKIATAMSWIGGFSKETAIASAIMNTYQGVTKTIAMLGMPWAIPFIALTIATGMKQVAAIANQPVPSAATGADVIREGFVHVHPGEVIRQPSSLKETIREVIREKGGRPIYVGIKIGNHVVRDFVVDIVNKDEDIVLRSRKIQ